jgi:hypothetical protein
VKRIECRGFELVVHQIPSRGEIDVTPPAWADGNADFFFGYDPEGNQLGIRQQT